jgi:hypothetical protein
MPHHSAQDSDSLNKPKEYLVGGWVLAGGRCPWPLRVILRFLALLLWSLSCYVAMRCIYLLTFKNPERRKQWVKRLARRWVSIMRGLFGIRLFGAGKIPEHPFFLVVNHHTWVEYFGINVILNARLVVMAEDIAFPIAGFLTRGLDPIFTDRRRENVPMVNRELIASVLRKESVMLAPEGAVTPGHTIRRYRAALLEAAVATQSPVHYATVHWRTPEGCLLPSQSVIYGPDPNVRDASGRLAATEIELWGPERSLLPHLIRFLALPYCDLVFCFGPAPIVGNDRISLANALYAASLDIFTPCA